MEFQPALSPRTSFFSCSRTQCTEDNDNWDNNNVGGDDGGGGDVGGGDDDGGDMYHFQFYLERRKPISDALVSSQIESSVPQLGSSNSAWF